MSRSFHLAVLSAGAGVAYVPLTANVTRVGSSPEAELHIADPELAPIQARIEARGNGHILVREHHPVLVNGLRAKAHLLAVNDLVVLGKNALLYREGDAPSDGRAAAGASALRRLHRFAERVRERGDAADLAEHLLADVLAVTGASRGTLVRLTAKDDPIRIATATRGSFSGAEVELSRTLLRRMCDEGRALLVANTAVDAITAEARSLAGLAQSAIVVPIVVDGRALGALYVSARAGVLGVPELELLELYASFSATLLDGERRAEALEGALSLLGEVPNEQDSLLVGASPCMRELRRSIHKVASGRASVLVVGETGTGKELVAREIHRLSPRASRPFVAVNCGAISPDLVASELFGHVKGSFTQAHKDRLGYFRSAEGGTLFLDEIGEMPPMQQVALLRVLQESEVTPVGADKSEPIDVRIICATNRAPDAEIVAGRLRQDLLFRIAVVTLALPPLRERGDDVVRLANLFLRREAREHAAPKLRFSDGALRAMCRARWEGNVRELESAVRRAVLMRESDEIGAGDLGFANEPNDANDHVVRPLAMARDEFLRGYVREVVERFGGNRTAAAEALHVTPRTIFKYLEE